MNPKILKYASYLISFLFMSMSIWEAVVCSKYPHPSSELNQIVYSYLVTASSMNMIMFFISFFMSCFIEHFKEIPLRYVINISTGINIWGFVLFTFNGIIESFYVLILCEIIFFWIRFIAFIILISYQCCTITEQITV